MQAQGGSFPDLKRHWLQLWKSPITWALWILLLGLQCWSAVAVDGDPDFYQIYGLSADGMRSLRLWQLLSHAGFHGSWSHWAMNGMLLLVLGSRIETMLGRVMLINVLIAGVLAGGVLHVLTSGNVLIGVSGGVFALALCLTTLSPESRFLIPFRVSGKNLGRGVMAASLILTLLDPNLGVPGLAAGGRKLLELGYDSLFRISHACHLGGALAGWLVARWLLRPRVTLERLRRTRAT